MFDTSRHEKVGRRTIMLEEEKQFLVSIKVDVLQLFHGFGADCATSYNFFMGLAHILQRLTRIPLVWQQFGGNFALAPDRPLGRSRVDLPRRLLQVILV